MEAKMDVIVVGAGLAGLVAATEAAEAGRQVFVVEQEGEQNLGGQAFGRWAGCSWSTRPNSAGSESKTHMSPCRADWMGTAGFDRPEDHWPRKWARRTSPSPPAKCAPG